MKAKSDRLGLGLTLIPFPSIFRLGKIFIEGLRYGKDNWKKGVNDKDYQEERLEHALRHLFLWKEGDRTEDHLAKVAWFCVTQMELERLEGIQPTNESVPIIAVFEIDGKPVKCSFPNTPPKGKFKSFENLDFVPKEQLETWKTWKYVCLNSNKEVNND
jgi:hypothetical protein